MTKHLISAKDIGKRIKKNKDTPIKRHTPIIEEEGESEQEESEQEGEGSEELFNKGREARGLEELVPDNTIKLVEKETEELGEEEH